MRWSTRYHADPAGGIDLADPLRKHEPPRERAGAVEATSDPAAASRIRPARAAASALAIIDQMLDGRPQSATSLIDVIPATPDADALYEAFVGWTEEQGLTLYPHQEEAAIELFSGNNVILATPTGSGKSMVADRRALRGARRRPRDVLHRADQGARVARSSSRCATIFGAEQRRHAHRRRVRQQRRADHLLHGGDPGQHRAARGRGRGRRAGRDGRVPLLRRARSAAGRGRCRCSASRRRSSC